MQLQNLSHFFHKHVHVQSYPDAKATKVYFISPTVSLMIHSSKTKMTDEAQPAGLIMVCSTLTKATHDANKGLILLSLVSATDVFFFFALGLFACLQTKQKREKRK